RPGPRPPRRRRAMRTPTPSEGSVMSVPTAEAAPADQPPTERRPGRVGGGLLDPRQLVASIPDALRKLNPMTLWRNPVMFIVEVGSVFTTVLAVRHPSVFAWLTTGGLGLPVVFANLAEAVAEGRGKAQAETLRRAKKDTIARRLAARRDRAGRGAGGGLGPPARR